ncbi:MAG: hypothetical protein R3225_00865 [Halofilum sp. (in: g-proteobacteria)]|nr:hypothetical protein [Halofilum sp. (in: g-proteobacteria)]
MVPSDLQAELIEDMESGATARTPEALARRLGVTLAEVREAEKTALRKLADPGRVQAADLDGLGLTPLEREVLAFLYCESRQRTPEDLAREFGVPLATVLEAKKVAMQQVQEKPHSTDDAA